MISFTQKGLYYIYSSPCFFSTSQYILKSPHISFCRRFLIVFFFIYLLVYLFLAVLDLRTCFLWLQWAGLLSSCGARASHCGRFSPCGALALRCLDLQLRHTGWVVLWVCGIFPDEGSNFHVPCVGRRIPNLLDNQKVSLIVFLNSITLYYINVHCFSVFPADAIMIVVFLQLSKQYCTEEPCLDVFCIVKSVYL